MTGRRISLAILAFALTTASANADSASAMADVAKGFYTAYATFHPSDGIPGAKDRAKYEPFISQALDKLLIDGEAAEARYAKANKNSPPLIEGDLFTSNFEGATSFKIGTCRAVNGAGECPVALVYDDHQGKPVTWTDTVHLTDSGGWRVDDIAYGASWEFGNKGSLAKTLRSAIANASE